MQVPPMRRIYSIPFSKIINNCWIMIALIQFHPGSTYFVQTPKPLQHPSKSFKQLPKPWSQSCAAGWWSSIGRDTIFNISWYFVNCLLNINSLNSFHLPFPYKYRFVIYENEMVGALILSQYHWGHWSMFRHRTLKENHGKWDKFFTILLCLTYVENVHFFLLEHDRNNHI